MSIFEATDALVLELQNRYQICHIVLLFVEHFYCWNLMRYILGRDS